MSLVVTIVGVGRVGGALARRLRDAGRSVVEVRRNDFDAWSSSATAIGDVLVIAVKDSVLRSVVETIAARRGAALTRTLVVHVNGSLGVDILAPCRDAGAMTAAAHPFQTFGDDDPSALDGIGWGVECDEASWTACRTFVESSGGRPVRLKGMTPERKRVYHASAVAASNFTYAAYELGRRLAEAAGIPADIFLAPIMERTQRNAVDALEKGLPFAMTGPVVRGDAEGVRLQLEAIPRELRDVYRHCSLALLATAADRLDAETVETLRTILSSNR